MTLTDLAADLPWGFHDAFIESLELDWLGARATFTIRLMISEHQDLDQRARVIIDGLVFCSVEPPEIDSARGYNPVPKDGLRISDGAGAAEPSRKSLPAVPEGCFLHWMYVGAWNRFIHVCGKNAKLEWLELAPVASRSENRALFPGDEIPDP